MNEDDLSFLREVSSGAPFEDLKKLDLSENHVGGCDSFGHLLDMVKQLVNLESLLLENSKMTEAQAVQLCSTIRCSLQGLRSLDLNGHDDWRPDAIRDCTSELDSLPMLESLALPATCQRGKKMVSVTIQAPSAGSGFGFRLGTWPGEDTLVSKVFEDGQARMAGLEEGDKIVRCNGRDLSRDTHEEIVHWIKECGDSLELLVERLDFDA